MPNETIILSVGGSIIVPNEIDIAFIKKFKEFVLEISKKNKIVLVVGGGKTARKYIDASIEFGLNNTQKDMIGIMATRLNAQYIKEIFGDFAYPEVIIDPIKKIDTDKRIIVAGGYKPGWSTDYCATLLAKTLNVKKMINLTNIYNVYNKDPKLFSDAIPLEEIEYSDLVKIVGDKWKPGLNAPFDPIATKLAMELKLELYITNGTDLDNLRKIVDGKKAKCTRIN